MSVAIQPREFLKFMPHGAHNACISFRVTRCLARCCVHPEELSFGKNAVKLVSELVLYRLQVLKRASCLPSTSPRACRLPVECLTFLRPACWTDGAPAAGDIIPAEILVPIPFTEATQTRPVLSQSRPTLGCVSWLEYCRLAFVHCHKNTALAPRMLL